MTLSRTGGGSYDAAGVRADAAHSALTALTARLRQTWPSSAEGRVLLDFGRYANVIDIGGGRGVAVCTDGVGSKTLIAELAGDYSTIGIDCVAMNVNDLVCVGARPLTFVDYLAVERVDSAVVAEIGEGLAAGGEMAGVSISGGEIAELPDTIRGARPGGGFDLAGTAVGTIAVDRILVGSAVQPGDAVVGIASGGIHANGMTLARKVLLADGGLGVSDPLPEAGCTVGAALLAPTSIYVREALALLDGAVDVRALIHITGDGFLNLGRVEAEVGFVLSDLPEPPQVFCAIAGRGNIAAAEMYTVFNMGVGMCAVVPETDVSAVIDAAAVEGKQAWRIGTVTSDVGVVKILANPLDGADLLTDGVGRLSSA